MKKLRFLSVIAVLMFCNCNIFAQKEHLKFSGIEIDGSITRFQSKLISKGYVSYTDLNSKLPAGSRAFKGTFVNNKVLACVYYDESSKNVYKVKVVVEDLSEDMAKQKLNEFRKLFNQKYEAYFIEDKDSFILVPMRDVNLSDDVDKWKNSLGEIDVYIRKNESLYNYPYHYSLHVDYTDQINSEKHENSVIEDL
ncbi:MAG: hypothetical protein J6P44_08590 [Bacteroidales bacterium]|nr:hypothetical protein [Bacteroidales bacterium]